jgi:hypothetical protein
VKQLRPYAVPVVATRRRRRCRKDDCKRLEELGAGGFCPAHRYQPQKCLVEDCERLEELKAGRPAGGGLCSGHRYRKKHGLSFETPFHEGLARKAHPRLAVVEVALQCAELPDDERAFRNWFTRLMYAVDRYKGLKGRSAPKAPGK